MNNMDELRNMNEAIEKQLEEQLEQHKEILNKQMPDILIKLSLNALQDIKSYLEDELSFLQEKLITLNKVISIKKNELQ